VDIAILGGTGAEGFGLALRLAGAGHAVTIGSRSADKAAKSVEDAAAILGPDAAVTGAVNAEAAAGKPVVFVTVPFAGLASTYDAVKEALVEGAVVCDCTSPLMTAVGGRATHAIRPWHGSAAEFAKTLLPKHVRLVAAFHTVAASALRAIEGPVDSDALVMGDDADAKATIGRLIDDIPGMRWVDCGGLQMARIAETLTPLVISINMRYRIHDAGFRITGRDGWGVPGT
jgi:8-hydroxy-5-deazaflavin:NADPH oxidoreductase